VVALGAAVALGPEWMRAPGWFSVVGLTLLAGAATWGALGAPRDSAGGRLWAPAGAALLLLAAAGAAVATWKISRIERRWPQVREAVITAASRQLGGELEAATRRVRRLAEQAATSPVGRPDAAFQELRPLVAARGVTDAVVLFDTAGRPVAWAGSQRVPVAPSGPELSALTSPFYLLLVARRQTSEGTAVATLLLARAPGAPVAGAALADAFAERTGVGLAFLEPHAAPADPDVFDFVLPSGAGARDTLFTVRPVPPEQGAALAQALGAARRAGFWLAILSLLVLASGATRLGAGPLSAVIPAAAGAVFLVRAPLKEAFGPGSLFWPDVYFRPLLGPFSASAGALLLTGIGISLLACAIWRRGFRATPLTVTVAVALTLLAPYLLRDLARGITPPAREVPPGLWLTWQCAIMVAASAVVLVAAALVRGRQTPQRAGPWPFVAAGIALAIAVVGLWLWDPGEVWPDWYAYLWLPALLLAVRPMPLRAAIAAVALVAGSAAALLTWGATTEGRIALAARDVEGLGDRPDPVAVALLERLARRATGEAPRTVGELYILWRRSSIGEQGYPASLAVWEPERDLRLRLDLADLDYGEDRLHALVAEALASGRPIVRSEPRVPGVHSVAGVPLEDGSVLTVVVGPLTRLAPATRVSRLLAGAPPELDPPYSLVLSPPTPGVAPSERARWRRDGWTVRGDRVLDLPGGARHVHAAIELGGPSPVLQRGVLALALDLAILVALWLLVELADGRSLPAFRQMAPRAYRSLRFRLTVSLAVFFVLPTLVFAVWSYGRLGEEFRSARALLLRRTLRDAGAVLRDTEPAAGAIAEAARRVDAELVLSSGGVLVAASAPAMADLGLADHLVSAEVYPRLVYGDELEAEAIDEEAPLPVLVGYRLLARDPAEPNAARILAAPDILSDQTLRRREGDLGIAVMVATLAGLIAALVLSGVAARALAQPVQRLREAALKVGAGERPPPETEVMPVELEPVHAAIRQAAEDIEAAQRAQRVLAWGEMARQVAHEIKNPLTPIRLGIQHLLRLYRERRDEFGATLQSTGERILAEINRLDAIARAFSRFAMPAEELAPLERVDLAGVAREVLALYRMGEGPPVWELEVQDAATAQARRDELVEVLVNLCENARDAGAGRVVLSVKAGDGTAVLSVRDDGRGIPSDVLARVFEPRFSTTTSGSGLGLAIAKRLVESWGGTIEIESRSGAGTTVRIKLGG
jgi:signal transduction histidine kinase